MRKASLAPLLAAGACLALAAFASTAALAAGGTGKPAATAVTIDTWPGGLSGEVRSPNAARCADGRRVVVYRVRGAQPDPRSDQRIGAARAQGAADTFGWSVEADDAGRFYAQAGPKRGCAAGRSEVVGAAGLGALTGAQYPPCGNYASETSSRICRIENLRLATFASRGEHVCDWVRDAAASGCFTRPESGPFPWAVPQGGGSMTWKTDGNTRSLSFNAYQVDRAGVVATLEGTLPAYNSQRFTVSDAIAPNEGPADPSGSDHFYTPDLPGQLVGEVGGPLKMEYGPSPQGTAFTFNGYLYLQR
jgi:hypothetical protein